MEAEIIPGFADRKTLETLRQFLMSTQTKQNVKMLEFEDTEA